MAKRWIWTLCIVFVGLQFSCKRRAADTTNDLIGKKEIKQKNTSGKDESREELESLSASELEARATATQAKIDALNAKLEDDSSLMLPDTERDKIIQDVQTLESELKAIKAQLKILKDSPQNSAGSQTPPPDDAGATVTPTSGTTATASSGVGASGKPYCGTNYFGTVFSCPGTNLKCAKSGAPYTDDKMCEIQGGSGGTAGFPPCGTQKLYGITWETGGIRYSKTSPDYADSSTCIVGTTATVTPTSGGSALGSSGYPYCGAKYYGDPFMHNGKNCAKSQPNYTAPCEITAQSFRAQGN